MLATRRFSALLPHWSFVLLWLITLSALLGGTRATSRRQEESREAATPSTLSLCQRLTLRHGTGEEQRWAFIKTGLGNCSSRTLSYGLGKFPGRGEKPLRLLAWWALLQSSGAGTRPPPASWRPRKHARKSSQSVVTQPEIEAVVDTHVCQLCARLLRTCLLLPSYLGRAAIHLGYRAGTRAK